MYTLKNWHRKKLFPTEDFPITVYYFKSVHNRDTHHSPSRHPEIEFILLHEGVFEMYTSGGLLTLQAGDIVLIEPNTLHGFRPTKDVTSLSVKFPLEFIELPPHHYFRKAFVEPMRNGSLRMPLLLSKEHPAYPRIYEALARLHPNREDEKGYRELLLETAFTVCTAILPYCTYTEETSYTPSGAIEACIRYISKHYQEKITLQQLANYVGLHPNYLCARFKGVVGQTVFGYLTQIRLEQAWDLLNTTELSVLDICQQCGFHSVGFFSQKFRERYGLTPKQAHKKYFKPNF